MWSNTQFGLLILLEDTARNAGLLLAPAEGFGRGCFGQFLAIFGVQ